MKDNIENNPKSIVERLTKFRFISYFVVLSTVMGGVLSFSETTSKFIDWSQKMLAIVLPSSESVETPSFWIMLNGVEGYKIVNRAGVEIFKAEDLGKGDTIIVLQERRPPPHFGEAIDDPLPLDTKTDDGKSVVRIRPAIGPTEITKKALIWPGIYPILDAYVVNERRRGGYSFQQGRCPTVVYYDSNQNEVGYDDAPYRKQVWVRIERTKTSYSFKRNDIQNPSEFCKDGKNA